MASACPIKNFRWYLPGLLATGDMPRLPGQLDWLIKQQFQAMVSLEPVPAEIFAEIDQSRLNYYLGTAEKDGSLSPLALQHYYSFTSHNLEAGKPTFVHGGKHLWSLIRKYLEFSLRAKGWLLPEITVYQSYSTPEVIIASAGERYRFDSQTGKFLPAGTNIRGLKTVFALTVPCRLIFRQNGDFQLVVNFEIWLPKYHIGRLAVVDLDPDWDQKAQTRLILEMAIALRSEDEAKWQWAHRHLDVDGCQTAVQILFKALASQSIEIRRLTLLALIDIFSHTGTDCRCFGKECLSLLSKAEHYLSLGFKKERDLALKPLFVRARRIFREYRGDMA
ncbi:MAG TPA: hypothetical protein VJK26_02920 [Patescibacteria group bacterium]|nr:hypothetical protein [Patescibacteria group bacterium]